MSTATSVPKPLPIGVRSSTNPAAFSFSSSETFGAIERSNCSVIQCTSIRYAPIHAFCSRSMRRTSGWSTMGSDPFGRSPRTDFGARDWMRSRA